MRGHPLSPELQGPFLVIGEAADTHSPCVVASKYAGQCSENFCTVQPSALQGVSSAHELWEARCHPS